MTVISLAQKVHAMLNTLKFPPEIEREFHEDYAQRSLPTVRIALVLASVLYGSFAILDLWANPSMLAEVWGIRFGVVIPVLLGICWLSYAPRFKEWMQPLLSVAMIVPAFGLTVIISLTEQRELAYKTYYVGFILITMGVYTLIQLRFRYAVFAALMAVAGYQVSALLIQDILSEPDGAVLLLNNNFFLIAANIIGMMAAYSMEFFARRDFSQRRLLAQRASELEAQKAEIERLRDQDKQYFQSLTQLKDDFLRTASHDLKNPLGNIKTSLWLLEKNVGITDDKGKFYLKQIDRSVTRMQTLISDLLDLAKLETGLALHREAVSLNEFLQRIASDFVLPAGEKQILMQFKPPLHPVQAYFDPHRMEQVLTNLISNAIKYTPAQGRVELGATIAGDTVSIYVKDTGLGIPAEDIPHLFEKFYRVEQAEHLAVEGTGLGLSIVQAIVEQHGGTIKVTSTVGKGSLFNVSLPQSVLSTAERPALMTA